MSRVNPSEHSASQSDLDSQLDPIFKNQIDRLYSLTVSVRWFVIILLWLTVGAYSLWELRYPISLIQEYFTWAAVRYGLAFQPIPAFGLALCVGMTTGTLVWQSRNVLWGIPKKDRQRLAKQVRQIRQQGSSHPLWKWVVKSIDN
jgi:hypothetical protein